MIRIRIRIHTSDWWIRIREAQKHVDPDSDPDPQHWSKVCLSKETWLASIPRGCRLERECRRRGRVQSRQFWCNPSCRWADSVASGLCSETENFYRSNVNEARFSAYIGNTFQQCCGSGSAWIRNDYGRDPDPDANEWKKLRNFTFWSSHCYLLRAKQTKWFFSAVKFYFFGYQNPGSWSALTWIARCGSTTLLFNTSVFLSISFIYIHLLQSVSRKPVRIQTKPELSVRFEKKSIHLQFCHFLVRVRRKSFNLTCEELSSGGRKVNPAQGKKMWIIYNL